jgi:hypothetical protein
VQAVTPAVEALAVRQACRLLLLLLPGRCLVDEVCMTRPVFPAQTYRVSVLVWSFR